MSTKVDFKYENGEKIFFVSDTHFGHSNIIKFCDRPFKDAEEMDYKLIENWNKKVPQDGLVFHLGDFAWGGHEYWKKIRSQLNGEIILIKGNHDQKNMSSTAEQELFKHVTWQMLIEIEGRKVLLNHFPFLCYAGVYREPSKLVFQAYGHVHSGEAKKGQDLPRLIHTYPMQYDVGVDNNNYEPISWYELNEKIQKQLLKSKFNVKNKD
jgi:calcineurin-like phosphoesterase family protein